MESDLSRYEIIPEGVIKSESTSIFNSASRQEHVNTSAGSLTTHIPLESTPHMPESDLSRYEIAPEGIIKSESTSMFNSVSRQEHANASTSSLLIAPLSNPLESTPRTSLATDNQLMSNYISSPHPDLPNQYNIIIAGDDDDEDDDDDIISQTLNSPQVHAMDIQQSMVAAPYRSYTVQFKLNALDWYYKNGENKNLTAKMFNVDRKRIRDWLLDERNLRSDPTPQRTKRKRANSLPQYKDIEEALYKFYLAQREKGVRPKNAELRAKSLEFASVLGYRETFKASIHWLCNWKRRNKISFAVPDHMIHNTAEEDEDSGTATSPFSEEQLGRAQPQRGRGVSGVSYGNAGVDGVNVQSTASGSGGYVGVNSRNSTGSNNVGNVGGRAYGSSGSDSLATPRSSSSVGGNVGSRAFSSTGMDHPNSQPRNAHGGGGGGGAYGNQGLDGLVGSRSVGGISNVVDGGLGVAQGDRRREAPHHINAQQEHMEDMNHNMGGLAGGLGYTASPQPAAKEHDASEHWMELLEQSILSLESDVARRFSQIKLLLQQFKKSRQPVHSNSDAPLPPPNAMPSHSSAGRLPPQARTQTNK